MKPQRAVPLNSVVIFATLLGVCLNTLLNGPGFLFVLFGAFSHPLLFVVVCGSLGLLMFLEYFLLKKFAGHRPLRFVTGPFLIIALLTFFFLSILIPTF